jgi:hypothetical protein
MARATDDHKGNQGELSQVYPWLKVVNKRSEDDFSSFFSKNDVPPNVVLISFP